MQPRQRSKCVVISGRSPRPPRGRCASAGSARAGSPSPPRTPRSSGTWAGRTRSARSRLIRSGSGGLCVVPGDRHQIPPTKAPGRKIRAGSKRSFTRAITASAPSGRRRPRLAYPIRAVEHHARARVQRLAHGGDVGAGRQRQPRQPERGARDDAAALLAARRAARPRRSVGRPGDLDDDAVVRALGGALARPRSPRRPPRRARPRARARASARPSRRPGAAAAAPPKRTSTRPTRRPTRRRGSRPPAGARPARARPSASRGAVGAARRPPSRARPAAGAAAPTPTAISPSVP